MSDVTAKVTDILSDRLGVLTTVTSSERILFDIEEFYLADDKCDSSRPLSSYVTAGETELKCDASFLPGNNKWNIWYKATCVWKYRKPSLTQIFGHHISNCSAPGSLVPGCTYEGHVVQVSPPHAALAILTVHSMSFPVLIFVNRLFKNSSLIELENCDWIQDHLNTGDKVEFKFEKRERKSVDKKWHVAAVAWKSEMEEHREQADEQPTADVLDISVQGGTHDLPAVEHRIYGLLATTQEDGAQSMLGGDYGAVSLYRIRCSLQDEEEKSLHLSGSGIVQNDCKVQTVYPQFSYELLKPPDEKEFQFRATLVGFIVFSYTVCGLPKSKNSCLPSDDVLSNVGIRILTASSHKQCGISKLPAAVGIELEMPLDPLQPTHVAVPRTPSSSQSGMPAYVTGVTLPEHVSCNVLTSSSNGCLQIPVCLERLPPHNPASEYMAGTFMNSRTGQGLFHFS
jgi:hypothetical protein